MQPHYHPQPPLYLYGLVDAAARQVDIHALLQQSGAACRSIFAGLPEEALGPASTFLVPIADADTDAPWFAELDAIDRHSPCLSLIWSRADPDALAKHLQAFLFADLGDGMTAMVRFFDPRNTPAVMRVWDDRIRHVFMAPIECWMHRGRHANWQRIENEAPGGACISGALTVRLDQAGIDALTAHTEPDELLATLIQSGVVDGTSPYLARLNEFMPRYRQAIEWGFTEPADRLSFCQYTYRYGAGFDRHPWIRDALVARRPLREVLATLPGHVRDELVRGRHAPTATSA